MKIKYNEKTDTFSLKGLDPKHLEVLYTLLNHTRLGYGIYEQAAFDLMDTFEDFKCRVASFTPEECNLGVQFLDSEPMIVLSHYND